MRAEKKEAQFGVLFNRGEQRAGMLSVTYQSLEESREQISSVGLSIHCRRAESREA